MAVLHSPESNYSKEIVKWEAQRSEHGVGQRPYVYREYPTRMYLAGPPSGGIGAITIVDEVEVGSENEAEPYRQRGFRAKPLDAIAAYDAQELEYSRLNANLNYQKTQMSPKAAAEITAAQDATSGHLPGVPVTPIKPRAKDKENS